MTNPCQKATRAFDQNPFQVSSVLTISGLAGYFVDTTIKVDEQPTNVLLGPDGDVKFGNYSFREGHAVHAVSSSSESCLGPRWWRLSKKANLDVKNSVDRFLREHAKNFGALRSQSRYISAGQAPAHLNPIIMWFDTTMVIGELVQKTEVAKKPEEDDISYLRRRFEDVGIEFVEDAGNRKTYVAIYGEVGDRGHKPPKFFLVFDEANQGRVIAFVHNYNEDTQSHYLRR